MSFFVVVALFSCLAAHGWKMTPPYSNATAMPPSSNCLSGTGAWTHTSHTSAAWTSPPTAKSTATVAVGAEGLNFSPSHVNADIGTVILFNFLALNHTLTQSSLSHPCKASGRFDTGFKQFNPRNVSGQFVVQYEVASDEPQWFFCAQTSHCRSGMVFSVNPGGLQRQFVSNALSAAGTPKPSPCGITASKNTTRPSIVSSSSTTFAATFNSSIQTSPALLSSGSINGVPLVQLLVYVFSIIM
ncbi:unnamed protein product [Periconia digitata]|uniref:Uncharacterized protein n=1 Tax=Periconia digitata TaxID=1303443 RepID=A0A9W4UL30_9PLEO|nr:unnamed protein product [Periconia digitata]